MFKQFFFLALLALSFGKVEAQKEVITLDLEPEKQDAMLEIFEVVEEMPTFPGCTETDARERKACADQKMLRWVYSQVTYPAIARIYEAEGIVVVGFVVDRDGSLTNIELRRSVLPKYDETIHDAEEINARRAAANALNEESLRVVNLMAALPEKWIPGKRNGQTVRVRYNLPIRFKLK